MHLFKRKSSRGAAQKQTPSRRPTAAPAVPPPTTIANSTLDLRTSCSSIVLDDSNITPLPSSPESQHRTLVKPVIGRKILNDQNANGSRRSTSVSFLPSSLRFPTNLYPSADHLALMPPKPTAICLRSLNQMLSRPHQKTLMTACISRIHLIRLLLALPDPPRSHQVQSTPLLDLAGKQTQTNSFTKPIPLLVHLSLGHSHPAVIPRNHTVRQVGLSTPYPPIHRRPQHAETVRKQGTRIQHLAILSACHQLPHPFLLSLVRAA